MNITHHFDNILCRAGHRSWGVLVRCTNSLQLITSQPHSDSAASWVVFSTVCYVCVCLFVCLFVCMCLFVNAITLEPFEIDIIVKFYGSKTWSKAWTSSKMLPFRHATTFHDDISNGSRVIALTNKQTQKDRHKWWLTCFWRSSYTLISTRDTSWMSTVDSTKVTCPLFDRSKILIPGDSPSIFPSLDKIWSFNSSQKRL